MSKDHEHHGPSHHDAELVIKLYDLRREAVMRASREAINGSFFPRDEAELLAIARPGHPHNAAFRQVSTYWEMVYGMAHHGIVHAEYFIENNGEGMFLFAKVAPHLARFRAEIAPHAFRHAEWAATETQAGRRYLEFARSRIAARMAAAH